MGEPGGLPFMGSHRVGHDWRDLAAAAATGTVDLVFVNYTNVEMNKNFRQKECVVVCVDIFVVCVHILRSSTSI